MPDRLTTEAVLAALPLPSINRLCARAGVSPMRLANARRGQVSGLTEDELRALERELRAVYDRLGEILPDLGE